VSPLAGPAGRCKRCGKKVWPRSTRIATGVVAIYLGFIPGMFIVSAVQEKLQEKHFNAMTPVQHLAEAKAALTSELPELAYEDITRHLQAIPADAPERREFPELLTTVNAALAARNQERAARNQERASAAAAVASQKEAARYLGEYLKGRGFDLTVEPSEAVDTLTITSGEFGDSDHRVRFLDMVRSRNGPQDVLCADGITKVTLKTQFPLFGFQETYGLCGQ
jgi:hypothetical protein